MITCDDAITRLSVQYPHIAEALKEDEGLVHVQFGTFSHLVQELRTEPFSIESGESVIVQTTFNLSVPFEENRFKLKLPGLIGKPDSSAELPVHVEITVHHPEPLRDARSETHQILVDVLERILRGTPNHTGRLTEIARRGLSDSDVHGRPPTGRTGLDQRPTRQ